MRNSIIILTIVFLTNSCGNGKLKKENESNLVNKDSSFRQDYRSSIVNIRIYSKENILESEIMFDTISKKKEGIARLYYKNGKLSQQGLWKNNKQEGLWRFYDSIGNITSEVNFKNDYQDGESFFYNNSGVIIEKSNWRNGKVDGEVYEYYDDGKLKKKSYWKKGRKLTEEK